MELWVPLAEVLQKPAKYGCIFTREIEYQPDVHKVSIFAKQTGYHLMQQLETETDHKYTPAIDLKKRKLFLISTAVTSQQLILRGNEGYESSEEIIRQFYELYGNEELGARGVVWFRNYPNEYVKCSGEYWSGSKTNFCEGKVVDTQNSTPARIGRMLYGNLPYENEQGPKSHGLPIRPLVLLDFKTLVKIDGTQDSPLEIRLPNAQENQTFFKKNIGINKAKRIPFVNLQDEANKIISVASGLSDDEKAQLRGLIEQMGQLF